MANKPQVSFLADGKFALISTSKDGKVSSEPFNGNQAMPTEKVVALVAGTVKGAGTMSDAWQSLLVLIFQAKPLDGYKGCGDRKTGKTSTTYKDAVRKAEDAFFDQCAADKIRGIPQNPIDRNEFVRVVRNDNNYKNIKNVVSRYFAFVGALARTDAGYLIPRQIMHAQINAVLDVPPEDSSMAGRINGLCREVEESTDADAIGKALTAAEALVNLLRARRDHHAELATNAAQNMPANAGVATKVATEVIGKAKRASRRRTEAAESVGQVADLPPVAQ